MMLPDHADPAVPEQRSARQTRQGAAEGSSVDPDTAVPLPCRSTVAPFLQLSLSASSAVLPAASGLVLSAGLPLLLPSTIIW